MLSDYISTGSSVNHNIEKAKNIFYKALDNNPLNQNPTSKATTNNMENR